MEECDVISVATEFMVGSQFNSRYDRGARVPISSQHTHTHHTSRMLLATSLDCLLISSRCDVISVDRVHGYTLQLISSRCDVISIDRVHGYTLRLLADFLTL
jgi:hypothetical protein